MTSSIAGRFARYGELTGELTAPVGLLDADALEANTSDMLARAAGTTIRLATKSLRCRPLITSLLARDGIRGVLTLTLAESLWLHDNGVDDIVLGYPTADRGGLRRLGRTDGDELPVVLMVDSLEQVDYAVAHARPTRSRPLRLCLELDASLRVGGRVHIGPRRSPVHSPAQLVALAERIARRPELRIEGVMAYEGQIAGVADAVPGLRSHAVRAMQAASRRELAARRAEAVAALGRIAELRFVNGGGTGSIESTRAEECITEIGAGSGFLAPALFDHYRGFRPRPALYAGFDVVRRPAPRIATIGGGGWIASGPPGADRLPTVAWPAGLSFTAMEGAGEAQSPLVGDAADRLRVGDRVWLRHAKAGEACEHVRELVVVRSDELAERWATYRGEGHAFL